LTEESKESTNIIGLSEYQQNRVEEVWKNREQVISEILKETYESFENKGYTESDIGLPVLVIDVINAPSKVKTTQIFVCDERQRFFRIGRVPENELCINAFMISRSHCRIVCENQEWFLIDGTPEKASLNGSQQYKKYRHLDRNLKYGSEGRAINIFSCRSS